MRLFKKDMNRFGAADVTETQDAVSAISKALQNGAEQQELATKRLADLAKSMNDMDANLRQGKRLQGEVERMDAELTTLREELEKKRAWAQEQSAKLANVQKERDKLRGQLETSKSELSARVEREAGLRDAEFQLRKEGEILNKELNQRTVRLEELVLVQKRVQEELTQARRGLIAKFQRLRYLEPKKQNKWGEQTHAKDIQHELARRYFGDPRILYDWLCLVCFPVSGCLASGIRDDARRDGSHSRSSRPDDFSLGITHHTRASLRPPLGH